MARSKATKKNATKTRATKSTAKAARDRQPPKAGTSAKARSTKAGSKTAERAESPKPRRKKAAASEGVSPKSRRPAKAAGRKARSTADKSGSPIAKPTRPDGRQAKLRAIRAAAAASEEVSHEAPPAPTSDEDGRRNFGLRGAAPWVARHAAKHAEELRRRNAEPPPPGSARATLRTPKEAELIKNRIGALHQRVGQINGLRKKLDRSFGEIGMLLAEIQQQQLYEAKGYSSFEAFVDREVEIPRATALRLIRIVHTFDEQAMLDYPLERLLTALSALDGELLQAPPSHAGKANPSSRGFSSTALPPKPPIRWQD